MNWFEQLENWLTQVSPWSHAAHLALVFILAWLGNFIVKKGLLRGVEKALGIITKDWKKDSSPHRAIRRIANIVPALIIMHGIDLIRGFPAETEKFFDNVCTSFITLMIALAASETLDAFSQNYQRKHNLRTHSIKGYVQLLKIILYVITSVMIISTLADKSPVTFLSGLGAMAAILMLVFQDTILSLVASVQIATNDIVRVGDWIEMPSLNADGDVIEIALHTIKVQNWDKTITTLPVRKLISEPFKNWRGMSESGGRRIKRALYLDQSSVAFLSANQLARLKKFRLLRDYLGEKEAEIEQWNRELGDFGDHDFNTRRITNFGTFRAYVIAYLRTHPKIHQKMTLLVRQLAPTPDGLPLEVYCFTNDIRWAEYEGIQGDVFDHLLSIMPEFGLRVFQNTSGNDLAALFIAQSQAAATLKEAPAPEREEDQEPLRASA